MTDLQFVEGLLGVCDKEERHAIEMEDKIMDEMDKYWTPYDGHKVSKVATLEKWRTLLIVTQSGQCSLSQKARELWYKLECMLSYDLKRFERV
jgi:hypothetical protein